VPAAVHGARLLAEELDPPDLAARLLIPADAEAAGGGIEDDVAGVLEVEPGSEDGGSLSEPSERFSPTISPW
jgi:hypothetical protein